VADINEVITLGIGTPASIKHFILVGLSPGVGTTTGVLSSSIGSFTLASTGTLAIAGSLSSSIGTFTLSAAGGVPVVVAGVTLAYNAEYSPTVTLSAEYSRTLTYEAEN
jgi:hypothetical protein